VRLLQTVICNINAIISNLKLNRKFNKDKNERPRFTHAKISNSLSNLINFETKIFNNVEYNNYNNMCHGSLIISGWSEKSPGKPQDRHRRQLRARSGREKKDIIKNVKNRGSKLKFDFARLEISNNRIITHNLYAYYTKLRVTLSGDVELNPGPNVNKSKLRVMTYNVQGLGNTAKLKRVNNILHKLDQRESYVINLQETHFKNEENIAYHWKWGVTQSLGSSNSCGVAILYSKSYFDEVIETRSDKIGRYCSVTLNRDGDVYTFVNVYAPNNHYKSFEFLEYIENEIEDILNRHPLTNLIISGDFNFVISQDKDSIGRNKSQQEKIVVDKFLEIAYKYSLVDTFRKLNDHGGYTWGKNNPIFLRSRLDYVFANKVLTNSVTSSYVTYTYNESDHNPVTSEFLIDEVVYGPGIIRGNSSLLEVPEIKNRIELELNKILEQIPKNWNPHQILDFYKYNLRILLLREGRKKAIIDRSRLELADAELGRLKEVLDKKLEENLNFPGNENNEAIESLKEAIFISEESTKDLRDEQARKLIFRARAKWSEKGEKSNKYFLNLVKERQRKMQIRKIISCGCTFYKQDEISKAISDFYSNLYKKQKDIKKIDKDHPMFSSLPSLNEEDAKFLKTKLTLEELFTTINTCNESAPGPDGISYDTYKHLWSISGPIILNAWEHSNKIGVTSISQRESIITLLDKKGKDSTKIENLRPISLSNCDIKLCTKALAIRTSKIIHKLVDSNQTGYVPGRQVTDNIRLLEEIIKEANNAGEKGYLITLDAQKAFDSVDHEYLIDLLRIYKFPDEYVRWIKILYSNLNACVLVNGYATVKFNIEQSVKQGDALSCVLFILAIEPLIKSLKVNNLIKPVTIKSNTTQEVTEVQTATYADDITALTSDEESIQLIIDEYEVFSMFSGIKLNVGKTEILVMGEAEFKEKRFEIRSKGSPITLINQETVKVCGVTLSNNPELAYKDNVLKKIMKLERQLDVWRMRNLTLQGKILIVKTFGISQLIYSFQSTYVRDSDLKSIDNIIFRFIWNIKKRNPIASGKIRREVLKKDYEKGGLNAPDINLINSAIKYKHILRHFNNNKHALHIIYNNHLGTKFGFSNFEYGNESQTFIGTAIRTHKQLGKLIQRDIIEVSDELDGIHKNYFAYVQNSELSNNPFTNVNQQAMVFRLNTYNIKTFGDVYREKQIMRFPNLFLDLHQIFNTYPVEWRKLVSKTNRVHAKIYNEVPIGLNKWQNTSIIEIKKLIQYLLSKTQSENVNEYIIKRHKLDIVDRQEFNDILNPFVELRRTTKDVKLKNIQYKILHNIYPTMKHLFTWKIKDNPNCTYCNVQENLKHAIFECPIARDCLNKLKEMIGIQNVNISYKDILLGFGACNNHNFGMPRTKLYAIDMILILVKQRLILQREEKRFISVNELRNLIINWMNVEKYNAKKVNKLIKYNAQYGWLETLIIV